MNSGNRQVDVTKILGAWQETLPTVLNDGDSAIVKADGADAGTLLIHINAAGHSMYSFDFTCTYVDDREVNVQLADVEQDNIAISEHNEIVQNLIADYVRHIHECAQILQQLTHA